MLYLFRSLLRSLGALLIIAATSPAWAQVALRLKSGQVFVGEAILSEDDRFIELKVCHSYVRKIPTTQVAERQVKPVTRPSRVLAATQPSASPRANPERFDANRRLIEDFFAADPAVRARAMARLREADAIATEDIERYREMIFAAARQGLKLREGNITFEHPQFRGTLHVEVHPRPSTRPATLPASTASTQPYALVLLLHGGGKGDGHWSSGAGMFIGGFSKALGRVVFICPNVLEKNYAEWGSNPTEEAYVKELLKAAKRTWPIDTDRVYCAGYSMGGYGTWHFGGHQADTFAGLVSGAGGILLGMRRGETWGWGILTNLMHTPIFFAHGKDDVPAPVWSDQEANRILGELGAQAEGTYPRKYVEYPSGGHGAATRGMGEGVKWVSGFRRDPNPKIIAWEPSRPFIRQFHWLQVDQPKFFQRLQAQVRGNTVDLSLLGVEGRVSIFLNEKLIDPGRPVSVRCEGKVVYEGPVRPSLSAMVESIEDKLDERQWYWGRVDLIVKP